MLHRFPGKSGLYIPQMYLGTMTFGGKGFCEPNGKLSVSGAETILDKALDVVVNFIDKVNAFYKGEVDMILINVIQSQSKPKKSP
jgi:aryl-alcohol dehydrogenase-like predicted oxidoreductase